MTSPTPARRFSVLVVAGLLSSVVGVPLVITLVLQFLASTAVVYAWGDGALLEMYTIHASRGPWPLGPYSHFNWHHPGPLFFYALLPLYELSGSNVLGLNAGAFAINLAALLTIAWGAVRWATPVTACALLVAVAVYLFRVGDITISYWNPHVVVLPLGAFILLCAGVAAGRAASIPGVVLAGSFLAQTHVSLVPTVAALLFVSLVALLVERAYRNGPSAHRTTGRWVAGSLVLLVLVWWLPLSEEVNSRPGNLSKLVHFFSEPYDGQPLMTAALAWGDAVSALFSREFKIPTGAAIQLSDGVLSPALAAIQVLLLVAAGWSAHRRADRFLGSLCWLGAIVSIVALWSITRIRTFIGEYMVFWLSLAASLNWAALAAAAVTRLQSTLQQVLARYRVPNVLAVLVVMGFVVGEAQQFHHNTQQPQETVARSVSVLTEAVREHLRRSGLKRPLVHISPAVWSEGAGVVVRLYKQGVTVAVTPEGVAFFGQPLAQNGEEDSIIHIVDSPTHAELSLRPSDLTIGGYGAVYIHASSLREDAQPQRD